ncbi:putative ribonuclease H-like domain-containing protein [Tanacetum coccineum]
MNFKRFNYVDAQGRSKSVMAWVSKRARFSYFLCRASQLELQEKGVIDSGYSRHMTGNKSCLSDYEEVNGGFVVFRGDPKGGKITGKGKISTGKLDFEDVYFVKELKFNLFSGLTNVWKGQTMFFTKHGMCCLSPDFKLLDENHVLLRVPKKDNMYSVDLKNIFSSGGRKHALSFMRSFGCLDTILNTIDHLGNQSNGIAGIKECENAGKAKEETVPGKDYILLPFFQDSQFSSSSKDSPDAGFKPSREEEKKDAEDLKNADSEVPNTEKPRVNQEQDANVNSTNNINITLMDLPHGKRAIGTKWVYRNKKDERGIVIRNKARLVAQGYTQEKGIDYDEVFAPVARIKAIRLLLAYASFKDFVLYQMDVKSAFLYGKIEEKVYVCQPPGFENPEFPNKVYKVEKALYGLHQALRAWYETLSTYLLEHGFQRGQIDKTLFIKRVKCDILLVQVYVDDIIFGSTKMELCTEFEKLIHKKFQMSFMGELTFFLGLQVTQKDDGIFISQDNYWKGQPKLGLWYPKDSPFDLEAYTDSDYAGASLDRKSTIGGCYGFSNQMLGLWIQFLNTKIFFDNDSTICIVKESSVSRKD